MINIFENTLLKWIFRQGNDSDRKSIVLNSGEPGYATDTKRLWVGDGTTNGGVLVGNIFKGSTPNITTLSPCELGDFAYNTSSRKLFRLISGDGSDINDWEEISGNYTPLDDTINITSDNEIGVNIGALSGFTLTPIYARYNGATETTIFQKNISSINKIGIGHYNFNFGPLETGNVVPYVAILGDSNLEYVPRVVAINNSSCQVRFQNLTGGYVDTELFLSIIR
jgi:hypothetical protein